MQKRIENIQKQEENLDQLNELFDKLEHLLDEWNALSTNYEQLIEYYESSQWLEDYDAYEDGNFRDIKCGVLSQDAVYNTIMRQRELSFKLIRLSLEKIE